MNTQTKNSLLLLLCSLIWGTAFVAQSAGSGMGAYSFLAGRSWLAVLVLIPTVMVFDAIRRKSGTDAKPKTAAEKKKLLAAGFVCGTLLFAASAAQQIGITINPSTAKAGFLTAMYVVLVPVFGLFLGRKGSAQLWVSMVVAVLGLYLLCMKNGFGSIESSDWLLLSCAVLFSFQIIAVDHFSPVSYTHLIGLAAVFLMDDPDACVPLCPCSTECRACLLYTSLYGQCNAEMISSAVTGVDFHPVALNRVFKDAKKSV